MKDIYNLYDLAKKHNLFISVVHNMRYNEGIKRINKELIDKIGNIQYICAQAGSYLPNWHPREDYNIMYSADKESGGAIFDFIHEIDYVMWLLRGTKVTDVQSMKMYDLFSDGPESGAIINLDFEGQFKAGIYVNFAQKISDRGCTIYGKDGIIDWDYYANCVIFGKDVYNYDFDKDDMYRDMLEDFIEKSKRGFDEEFQHDIEVLKVALNARNKKNYEK